MKRLNKTKKFLVEKLQECFSSFFQEKTTDDKKNLIPHSFLQGDFLRIEFEVPQVLFPQDLIDWLARQNIHNKFYWAERDNSYEIAGLGYADLISDNMQIPAVDYMDLFALLNKRLLGTSGTPDVKGIQGSGSNPGILGLTDTANFPANQEILKKETLYKSLTPLRYFGAIAFSTGDRVKDEWKNFGNFYFFVPRIELINAGCKKIFAVNILSGKTGDLKDTFSEITSIIEKLDFNIPGGKTESSKTMFSLKITGRTDIPGRKNWIENLQKAIKIFDESKLEKIVLARKTIFKTGGQINPFSLLQQLRRANIRTFNFCIQPLAKTAFLGCSPELLYMRKNGRLYSEAVAGTVTSGKTLKEEKLLASKLLGSEKDSEEYQFVYDSIKRDLNSIGTNFEVETEKEVLKLSYAQHIISRFHCDIKTGIDDSRIIRALHPTPAVGGFPKKDIIKNIKVYEDFSRGFYAGPVGWVSKNSSEFVVGIRTALINKDTLSLYSGAGIVSKSIPEMEWDEIENKINPFLKLMKFD